MSEKTKVLVVDDDPLVSEMLGMILESSEYDVELAANGAEALRKIQSDPDIGLLISDMNMPVMNGLELIKELRGAGSDMPIIILTGNNEISVAIDAMNSGANDYLLKDENIQDTVLLSVSKVLEKHHLKKQNIQLMKDLAEKNDRLEKEKAIAQKVQNNILPRGLAFDGVEVGTFYRPSDKIGGDFYDAWDADNSVHFLIGDVSGHSTSSALVMAVSKGIFHSLGHSIKDPVEIMETANAMLCNILTDSGMFVSMVYGILDRENGQLKIVSAGHNPVYIVKGNAVAAIESTGPVLGWDPDDTWEVHTIPFESGATAVLYTDGITEAKNTSGEDFGEERLEVLIKNIESPRETIDSIYRQALEFSGGDFPDDLTLLILKRE